GLDFGRDYLQILDPLEGKAREVKVPVRENPNRRSYFPLKIGEPSPFWGTDILWEAPAHPHNPMMDSKGRIWITQQIRETNNVPAFCKEGSDHPSAKLYPRPTGVQYQAAVFEPKTQKFTLIDTCFGTHHLQFDEDADDTLYFSGIGDTVGWINSRMFDQT